MSPVSPWTISQVSRPASGLDIARYRHNRLLSLQSDRQYFGSNYEREAAFTAEDWRDRLDSPGKATFVASIATPGSDDHSTGVYPGRTNEATTAKEGDQVEGWVGMATVLGPAAVANIPVYANAGSLLEEGTGHRSVYIIVGVWVKSEWRRRGIGMELMREALSWVRGDGEMQSEAFTTGSKSVLLSVHASNIVARNAYRRCGFQELKECPSRTDEAEGDVEIYMVYHF